MVDAALDRPGADADADIDEAVDDAPLSADPVAYRRPPPVGFDAEGRTPDVVFEVPPGTRTVTLYAEGREDTLYVFERIIDGGGDVWVDPAPPDRPLDALDHAMLPFPGPYLSANRTAWGDAVATAMVPNNPAVTPTPGTWRVRLAASPPPPPDETIAVVAQLEAGPTPARGRLDLHFHFTEAGNYSAATAANDPAFRQMLNHVTVLLRDAGVDVGRLTYRDVPVARSTIDVHRLGRLLALSDAPDGVSIFFVGRIEDDRGGAMAGLAGGVPTSSLAGTGANGVAIARRLAMEPEELAMTITHEIGHALGLYHTVEVGTPYVDQLDDTADDDVASRENVMHPIAGAEARRFSVEQGRVMRSSRSVEGE